MAIRLKTQEQVLKALITCSTFSLLIIAIFGAMAALATQKKLVHLVRSYFRLDGHHIQFNVVDAATLRAAQKEPLKYRDLIVRVAGYSDYFCDLGQELQDEIIARTEHQSF